MNIVHSAVSRVLINTKYFDVTELKAFGLSKEERDRQKRVEYINQEIVDEGNSLVPHSLLVIDLNNAVVNISRKKSKVRIDYEVTFINVRIGKPFKKQPFKITSKTPCSTATYRRIQKSRFNREAASSSAIESVSETNKDIINSVVIDAVNGQGEYYFNKWVRNEFDLNLYCLDILRNERQQIYGVRVEGGDNINMKKGCRLMLVCITPRKGSSGQFIDHEIIARLKVNEVSHSSVMCRIIEGKSRLSHIAPDKLRVVFDEYHKL